MGVRSLSAWEECDWEGRARRPRDGVDRFGGEGAWGMELMGAGAGVGPATCTMHMCVCRACVCVCAPVCLRVGEGGGLGEREGEGEMAVCRYVIRERCANARCTCNAYIPEGRSGKAARLCHPVVARRRARWQEVGRADGARGPGGRRSGTEVWLAARAGGGRVCSSLCLLWTGSSETEGAEDGG